MNSLSNRLNSETFSYILQPLTFSCMFSTPVLGGKPREKKMFRLASTDILFAAEDLNDPGASPLVLNLLTFLFFLFFKNAF